MTLGWLAVSGLGCSSGEQTKDGAFDSADRFDECDQDVGTADVYTSPELDPLLALYEASAGVTWSASWTCDDGVAREVTVSYTAVDRTGIHVTERVTDPDREWTRSCGWGWVETPVVVGGDTLAWSGSARFELGVADSGEPEAVLWAAIEPDARRAATTGTGAGTGTRFVFSQAPGAGPEGILEGGAPVGWRCEGPLTAAR